MYPLRRIRPFAAAMAFAGAVALSGCAATNVGSYLASQADLTRYHSFAWATPDHFETGDPRLDNNPFFQDRAQAAIEKELASRGFEKTTAGSAALIVHYYLNVKQQIHADEAEQVQANQTEEQSGYGTGSAPYVYDDSTLVIDLVDARTDKLVWRGWVEGSVEGAIDNQRADGAADRQGGRPHSDQAAEALLERRASAAGSMAPPGRQSAGSANTAKRPCRAWRDRKNRNRRLPEHLLGRRPEQEPAGAAQSTGSHDDEIGPESGGPLDDDRGGFAEGDGVADGPCRQRATL